MAKSTRPAPAAASAKGNGKTWVIAAVAVIVVILLIVWAKKGGEAPVSPDEAAPKAEPSPEAEPEVATAPETASGEEIASGRPPRELGAPGNAEIVSQEVTWTPGGGQPAMKEEGNSMFGGITCQHAQLPEGELSTAKEDALTFTMTNKGQKAYHLYYVKYGSEGFEDAMRISINGRRVRDVERACGQLDLAPGETVTCSGAQAVLRTGQTYTGKQQVNGLEAQTNEFVDNVVFKC